MKKIVAKVGRLWCVGTGVCILRFLQNSRGFDPETGLALRSVPGMAAAALLLASAAVELAMSLRLPKDREDYAAWFAPPGRELPPLVCGSMLLAAGGLVMALPAFPAGEAAAAAAGLLAAAAGGGFLVLARQVRSDGEVHVSPALPAMFFGIFFVLTVYLPIENDPVLARYYLSVLAAAAVACAFSQLAGFLRKEGSPRWFRFTADMSVILCLSALADGGLAHVLLFAGCALLLTVFLLLMRGSVPETTK